jgi:hypothetical protein
MVRQELKEEERAIAYPSQPLAATSPAINAGDPGGCRDSDGTLLPRDQRHETQPDRCDIGAYEFRASTERGLLPVTIR